MTWYASIAIIVVVWSVSRIRSSGLQALIYSLPIPITIVMGTMHLSVTSDQIFGVGALVVYFVVVSVTRPVTGRYPSVLLGVAAYVLIALVVAALPDVPIPVATAIVVGGWLVHAAVSLMRGLLIVERPPAPKVGLGTEVGRVGILAVATFALVWIGNALGGLSTTFPYSGVLVSVSESGPTLPFTRQFALASVALVAYFVAWSAVQDHVELLPCILVAWAAYGLVAVLVVPVRRAADARARRAS